VVVVGDGVALDKAQNTLKGQAKNREEEGAFVEISIDDAGKLAAGGRLVGGREGDDEDGMNGRVEAQEEA
jgi:hypothetical protein